MKTYGNTLKSKALIIFMPLALLGCVTNGPNKNVSIKQPIPYGIVLSPDKEIEWPEKTLNGDNDPSEMISQFNSLFQDYQKTGSIKPKDLALIDCQLDKEQEDKISKIANFDNDIINFKIKASQPHIMSTPKGCYELSKVELEFFSGGYRIDSKVSEPWYLEALTITSYGYDSPSTQGRGHYFFEELTTPLNVKYSMRTVYLSTDVDGDRSINVTYSKSKLRENFNEDTMSISLDNYNLAKSYYGGIKYHLNSSSKPEIYSFRGKYELLQMMNSQLKGLQIVDDSLWGDPSDKPLSYSCYVNGESLDIFRMTGLFDCGAATENEIGLADVMVSRSYIPPEKPEPDYEIEKPYEPLLANELHDLTPVQEINQPLINTEFQKQKQQEKCSLVSDNWTYIEGDCVNSLAQGKGIAVNVEGLRFEGSFNEGKRTEGEILQNGEMIFAGKLEDDKPHGEALCQYEGEYEECRFYKGKRIDSLYKIRLEMAKQTEANTLLAQKTQGSRPSSASDIAIDAVKKEGAKRAATFLFDQLF